MKRAAYRSEAEAERHYLALLAEQERIVDELREAGFDAVTELEFASRIHLYAGDERSRGRGRE